jgi:hypothetical protein
MKTIVLGALLSGALILALHAQPEPLPYTEGTVWAVSMVKVKPGFEEEYLKSLGATWKKTFDEAKKQKLVLSYKVLASDPANRDDWGLLLMVEYKNMAALDGVDEKLRAISLPILGGSEGQKQLMTKRLEVREIVGVKLARELILK